MLTFFRRFLRAGSAHQRRHDSHCHHQCDGGRDDLAGEEWKNSVFWVEGLDEWFEGVSRLGVSFRWCRHTREDDNAEFPSLITLGAVFMEYWIKTDDAGHRDRWYGWPTVQLAWVKLG